MVESFLYTPKTVTTVAPHARSYIDMKRIMTYVVLATIPCILMALYNTGYQTNMAIAEMGASGWRASIIEALGIGFDANNVAANMFHGLLYFLPIYITTLVAGGVFEVIFATVRKPRSQRRLPRFIHAVRADRASKHPACGRLHWASSLAW